MGSGAILYPEDKIPFLHLLPMGMQHVVSIHALGSLHLLPVQRDGFYPRLQRLAD